MTCAYIIIIFCCIHKTWLRSKGTKSIYTHIHVYAPQDVCREITTSTQGNGSDQLLNGGLYIYISKRNMKSRGLLTRMHAGI